MHRFADKEVQRDSKMVSYKVVDKIGKPYVSVNIAGEEKTYSPEEISAMVLTKVGAIADACNSLSNEHCSCERADCSNFALFQLSVFQLRIF